MGEEARFVARYASVYVRGETFKEVGDELHARGFAMHRATQTDSGVLVIPHAEEGQQAAHLFAKLDTAEEAVKPHNDVTGCTCEHFRVQHAAGAGEARWRCPDHGHVDESPRSIEAAGADLAYAAVMAGVVEPIPLTCGTCGSVHPEGVVCVVPIMFKRIGCCHTVTTYAHDGPHEARTDDGVVTHRWIEETVITDLPFNFYGAYSEEEGQ